MIRDTFCFAYSTVTVGKQTPCKLSFAHTTVTSQTILTVRAKPKFGKILVLFAYYKLFMRYLYIISYVAHFFVCKTVKTFTIHQPVAYYWNTSEVLKMLTILKKENIAN